MTERIATGSLLGVVLFWFGASFWVRGASVPDWWLPVALAVGLAATARLRVAPRGERPRWLPITSACVIGVAFAAMAFGALETPSRHWDGAASFDAKVHWLTTAPTLNQPFFASSDVFHHSPDYPLLQPLLVAMTERLLPGFGRLVLPLLYLLLCSVVATALRRRGVSLPLPSRWRLSQRSSGPAATSD